MNPHHTPPSADDLDRLAARRASAKLGWYLHAAVYLAVNGGLWALAWPRGHSWPIYPLLGWGLGLALHGGAVWLAGPGAALRERLVERERAALARRTR